MSSTDNKAQQQDNDDVQLYVFNTVQQYNPIIDNIMSMCDSINALFYRCIKSHEHERAEAYMHKLALVNEYLNDVHAKIEQIVNQ